MPPSFHYKMAAQRNSELYYEELGAQFDNWISLYDVERRRELISQLLPPAAITMSCLEVGCGTGRISETIKPLVGRLTVADISQELAKGVGARLEVDWVQQDACNLQLPNASFDLVISSECIEHTPSPEKALVEMARVLKKGGCLIVTSPNKLWFPLMWLATVTKVRRFAGTENWLFPWRVAEVLRQHGLSNIRLGGCHLFPWQIPFAKTVLPLFDRFERVLYPVMINYGVRGMKV